MKGKLKQYDLSSQPANPKQRSRKIFDGQAIERRARSIHFSKIIFEAGAFLSEKSSFAIIPLPL